MYNEEDYYQYEPSEADEIISEATEHLVSLIKSKAKRDITEVIEENKRITDENKKLKDEAYEVKKLKTEYESKLKSLESEFYHSKLKDVVEKTNILSQIWTIDRRYDKQEKCNKCDEHRNLIAVDGYGIKHEVPCVCASSSMSYYTYPILLCNIVLYKTDREELNMYGNYFDNKKEIGISFDKYNKRVVLDTIDTNISYIRCFYRTQEEAQKHCDYLNKIEKQNILTN